MKKIYIVTIAVLLIISSGIIVFRDWISTGPVYDNFEDFADHSVPGLMRKYKVVGASVAILNSGEIHNIKTFGYADRKNRINNSKEKMFRVASLSKPVTAWGIMKLAGEKKINLEDPVEIYLTRWQFPESRYDSKKVTIERLLTHHAGVSVSMYGGYSQDKKRATIVESLNGENVALGPVKLIADPGSGVRYSGGGYSVLQLLIEDVTGLSYENYMAENVLKPLGLKNFTYTYSPDLNVRMALPYGMNRNRLPVFLYTEKAAGGLICSVEDLATFALAFVNDQNVLQKETILSITDKKRIPIVGILEENNKKFIGFGGTTLGYTADFWLDTNEKNGYAYVSNSNSGIFLGAEIADFWLKKNALIPDPTKMIFNIEIYGFRALSFILFWIFIIIIWRKTVKIINRREYIDFRRKKKYFVARLLISFLVISAILFWWMFFHTLKFYPRYQMPWLPHSFVYFSIFLSLIILFFISSNLFTGKIKRNKNKLITE